MSEKLPWEWTASNRNNYYGKLTCRSKLFFSTMRGQTIEETLQSSSVVGAIPCSFRRKNSR